jgi:nucleoside-diphosphate-sugar epimerase
MAQRNGAKLVDVSTSEVYGGGQDGYCSEEFPKIVSAKTSARLEYAVGKLAAEVMIINLCTMGQLDAAIIRPFNVAGPRQSCRGGFVLPRFVTSALQHKALTVFGDGRQVRAFTHGRDVARGIVLAMERGRSGEVYNVGNPENRCSILELAQTVVALSGSRSAITFVDPKAIFGPLYEEANDKYPDATKTMRELGWKPEFSKRDIILETIRYFQRLPERVFKHLEGSRT